MEGIDYKIDEEMREEFKVVIVHVKQFEAANIQLCRSTEKMSEVVAEGL